MECVRNFLLDEFLEDKILLDGPGINITASFEGESRTFLAHEHILSRNSPVFRAMLNTTCKETTSGVIEINDFPPSTVEKMLTFYYTKSVDVNNLDDVIALFKISDKYLMNELKIKCLETFEKYLNEQNVFKIYLTLETNYTDTSAFKICKNLISSFFRALILFDEFLHLDEKLVKDILSWEILNVQSEYDIYRAAVRWAIHKCIEKKLCVCEEHLASEGNSLFACVQYDRLSLDELQNVLPSVRNVAQNTEKVDRNAVKYNNVLALLDKISFCNWTLLKPCSISVKQTFLSFRPLEPKIFLVGFRAMLRVLTNSSSTVQTIPVEFSLYCDQTFITKCELQVPRGINYGSYPIIFPEPLELQRDKLFFVSCSGSFQFGALETLKLEEVSKKPEMFHIPGEVIAIHSIHFIAKGFPKVSVLSD